MLVFVANRRAAAPVSAGVAMEVPLMTPYPAGTVDITPTPGPVTSVSGPILEKLAIKMFLVLSVRCCNAPSRFSAVRKSAFSAHCRDRLAHAIRGWETNGLT